MATRALQHAGDSRGCLLHRLRVPMKRRQVGGQRKRISQTNRMAHTLRFFNRLTYHLL